MHARVDPGSHAVLVVCDGVSSSTDSDVAALAAARAARDVLAGSTPGGIGTAAARVAATARALDAAAQAANDAVVLHTAAGSPNPASCTFVAGVVQDSLLVVGWVGDSRAYWLPDTGEPAPADDGRLLRRRADRLRRLPGRRRERTAGPRDHPVARIRHPRPHPADDLARPHRPGLGAGVLRRAVELLLRARRHGAPSLRELGGAPTADPLVVAGALVDWANTQGGIDNITVALARIDPPPTARRDVRGTQRGSHPRWQRSQLRSFRTSSSPTAGATSTRS